MNEGDGLWHCCEAVVLLQAVTRCQIVGTITECVASTLGEQRERCRSDSEGKGRDDGDCESFPAS